MEAVIDHVLNAPVGSVLVLAGIAFLFIGVVGNVTGKIEPGPKGRIAGGVAGVALLGVGLTVFPPGAPDKPAPLPDKPVSLPIIPLPASAANAAASTNPGRCSTLAEGLFADSRDQRLAAQEALIRNCAGNSTEIARMIDIARTHAGNRAGIYDALSFLDRVTATDIRDPVTRTKIFDFARDAAGNSEDSAVLAAHLTQRYRQ